MENINEIIKEIAQTVYNNVPVDNWDKVLVNVSMLTTYNELTVTYYVDDIKGKSFNPNYPGAPKNKKVNSLFAELRKGMYALTPGKGAWYDAEMTITKEGKFNMKYNYDNKPNFEMIPDDDEYIMDTKEFPRDEQSTPDWLSKVINE